MYYFVYYIPVCAYEVSCGRLYDAHLSPNHTQVMVNDPKVTHSK